MYMYRCITMIIHICTTIVIAECPSNRHLQIWSAEAEVCGPCRWVWLLSVLSGRKDLGAVFIGCGLFRGWVFRHFYWITMGFLWDFH